MSIGTIVMPKLPKFEFFAKPVSWTPDSYIKLPGPPLPLEVLSFTCPKLNYQCTLPSLQNLLHSRISPSPLKASQFQYFRTKPWSLPWCLFLLPFSSYIPYLIHHWIVLIRFPDHPESRIIFNSPVHRPNWVINWIITSLQQPLPWSPWFHLPCHILFSTQKPEPYTKLKLIRFLIL